MARRVTPGIPLTTALLVALGLLPTPSGAQDLEGCVRGVATSGQVDSVAVAFTRFDPRTSERHEDLEATGPLFLVDFIGDVNCESAGRLAVLFPHGHQVMASQQALTATGAVPQPGNAAPARAELADMGIEVEYYPRHDIIFVTGVVPLETGAVRTAYHQVSLERFPEDQMTIYLRKVAEKLLRVIYEQKGMTLEIPDRTVRWAVTPFENLTGDSGNELYVKSVPILLRKRLLEESAGDFDFPLDTEEDSFVGAIGESGLITDPAELATRPPFQSVGAILTGSLHTIGNELYLEYCVVSVSRRRCVLEGDVPAPGGFTSAVFETVVDKIVNEWSFGELRSRLESES